MGNLMLNVSEDFDVAAAAQELADSFQAKGYTARCIKNKNGARVFIEKGMGGINTLTGLGVSTTANITVMKGGVLSVTFENEWMSKIIACTVGWFVCLLPGIMGIVGIIKQSSLPKEVENELSMLLSE